jgi:hypothetical protein
MDMQGEKRASTLQTQNVLLTADQRVCILHFVSKVLLSLLRQVRQLQLQPRVAREQAPSSTPTGTQCDLVSLHTIWERQDRKTIMDKQYVSSVPCSIA